MENMRSSRVQFVFYPARIGSREHANVLKKTGSQLIASSHLKEPINPVPVVDNSDSIAMANSTQVWKACTKITPVIYI